MNLIKLGGLLGLAYFGSKAIAARGGPRAVLESLGQSARDAAQSRGLRLGTAGGAGYGSSTGPATGNAGEQLNAARLSSLSAAPGGSGDDLLQSSSQSGPGPRSTGLGDFARGA
ncbi:MAG: hypothetical protein ACK4PH_16775 [Aquincola tertiaricarbonis]|uniref:hypothetical protein n=1 Tax=Aquincola sp. J276 TaxID=2898432 RepID=UPI002150A059|nr:hypothetical protein [Aquincola sp. J276]MCR5864180.1 hypothetical protein [Aquincola sp. J276]